MNIIKSLATVSFFTMLNKLTGFFRAMLMTSILGASIVTDALIIALKIANMLRKIFAEGAFNSAFVPFFSKINKINGIKKANSLACKTFSLLLYTTIIISILVIFFYEKIIYFFAPGFEGARLQETIFLGKILFPFIISACLVALMSSILNTFGRFAVPSSIQILINLAAIFALIGSEYYFETDTATCIAYAILIAGFIQVIILWINLYKMGFVIKLRANIFSSSVIKIIKNMAPSVLAVGVYELNSIVGNQFSSMLGTGCISYLFYAEQILQLPFSIFGIALGSALLPTFTANINRKLFKTLNFNYNKTLAFSMGFSIPATISIFIISDIIVAFIYGRGKFSLTDVNAVASILKITILSLPMQIFIKIAASLFFADDNNTIPLKGALINFITNFITIAALINVYGYIAIAFGTVIASFFHALYLNAKLPKYLYILKIFKIVIFKQFIGGCIVGGYCFFVENMFERFYFFGEITKLIIMILVVGSGSILYTFIGSKLGFFNLVKMIKEIKK